SLAPPPVPPTARPPPPPRPRPPPAPPPEDGREQIAQPAERPQIGQIEVGPTGPPPPPLRWAPAAHPRTEPASPTAGERAIAAQLVVLLAFVGVAQHVMRFVDLFEPIGGAGIIGVPVGMVLLGKATKRLLDLVHCRRFGHAQDLIVVLRRRHQPLSPCGPRCRPRSSASPCHLSTTTRAGRISMPAS